MSNDKEILKLFGGSKKKRSSAKQDSEVSYSEEEEPVHVPFKKRKNFEKLKEDKKKSKKKSKKDSFESDDSANFEDDDEYDDDLYKDAEDRKYLESLPEVEREDILTQRYHERTNRRNRRNMKSTREKTTKGKAKVDKKHPKKKMAQMSDSEDGEFDKMNSENDEDDFVDFDDSSSINSPRGEEKVSKPKKEEEVEDVLTVDDMNRVRISRTTLSKLLDGPIKKVIGKLIGLYVRVMIGTDGTSNPVYRLTKIDDVKDGKDYEFDGKKTNKYLNLTFAGSPPKDFKFTYVSNSNFTELEFTKWEGMMQRDKLHLPTRENLKLKENNLEEIANFRYTEEDISKMVNLESVKKNNPIKAKRVLLSRLEKAKTANNLEDMERIEKEISELNERIEVHKYESEKDDFTRKLREINERNKQINYTKSKIDVPESAYSRRKTVSTVIVSVGDSKDKNDTNKTTGKDTNKTEETSKSNKSNQEVQKTVLGLPRNNPQDVLFGSHKQLDIVFDLVSPNVPQRPPSYSLEGLTSSVSASKSTQFLTVSEYKRRRGL